ncbi:MAG TPA: GNAT family N-acetyltransferase [Abditibacteriaceae bacterium]|jgi:CelD/BcsL family acetyltransferase involved in cellulose biosynthesis
MTIFQTPAYLAAYRRAFGAGKTFSRLTTRDGNDWGVAWLQTRGKVVRRLEWWGAGIHDVGGAALSGETGAALLWPKIEAAAHKTDGALLAQIEATSPLVNLARASGWQIVPAEPCPVATLAPTWDEYLAGLGKNRREQLRRYPKRLDKEFKVETELATEETVQTALSDLYRLHGKRWRARGQTGVLATPKRQQFHRALCAKLQRQDRLRLWTLRCDGYAVCVLLSYFYDKRYSFFIGGFEPDLMRWSVGTCLFARVLQHAISEGATEFDFLRGQEDYKYKLGAVDRNYVSLSWFAPTSRGKVLQRRIALEAAATHKIHLMFSAAHREPKANEPKK